ncbi:polysaccharide biosynthesis tyrosine autokinase [Demequina rhizosphaerae]|uniref:polysaccharide biosynthesis tyrosine autokinase n=1 Tax=Demequina rhizosphaerae TaxID=1638985 RepID=UPI0007842F6D|nr:polysaccharide biosynthesis tyrosine autokinase [Demequina rhizosphaerae]
MELRDYVAIMRARWLSIAIITLLVGGAAFGWTMLQPKVYTASSSVIVTPGTAWANGNGLIAEDYARTRIASYAVVAKSDQVAQYAAEQEGVSGSPYGLVSRISVSNPSDTALLRFTATGPTAESARRLAEVWVEGTTIAINEIEKTAQNNNAAVTVTTLEAPRLPLLPSSPRIKQAVAVGLMLGLVLGVAYAFVRASLDRRVRTREDVERSVSTPVVGMLPWDGAIAKRGPARAAPDFAMTEAVRQLRTNLQFMDVDHPPRVFVVTSPMPGDGKSTTSIMLAEAIAESGTPVVLVDADLRRPTIASNMGLVSAAGLTSVLAGRAEVADVVQCAGPSGRLSVLTSGPIPPNPSELVGSDAMQSLLYSFPADTIVLVDSPPLLPVTDASVLAARTDGALVVIRAGSATVDTLGEALANLERVRGRALGVILNGVASSARKLGYGYGYTAHRGEGSLPAMITGSDAAHDDDADADDADDRRPEDGVDAADGAARDGLDDVEVDAEDLDDDGARAEAGDARVGR